MDYFDFYNAALDCATDRHISFHMPGHKGRPTGTLFDSILPFDLTELRGTDNLLSPEKEGSLEKTFARFREIYNTKSTVFSAGGATAALNAAISAVVRIRGKKVICDRSAHLSIIYTLSHCAATPIFVRRDQTYNLDTAAVIETISAHTDAACIIITSPDYYGRICDISAICTAAKTYGIPVIVDSAHGAHLPFYQDGELSAYKNGASFVIESLHKTLPALTGAALLHSDGTLSEETLLTAMRHFASSSPSYLISISICSAVALMKTKGRVLLDSLLHHINDAKKKLAASGFTFPHYRLCDPFRLCICPPAGKSPSDLYNYLYDHGVVCEFYDLNSVVLIPSVINKKADFDVLCTLCNDFAKTTAKSFYIPTQLPEINPKAARSMTESLISSVPRRVPISEAIGKICAEPQAPYPPGTVVIVPGEIYDIDVINYLTACGFDYVWIAE